MRKIEIEEVRSIQMNIYDYIDNFCRDNRIRYTMSGGTLLGAVRHGGFIPWDDDMDIQMTRDEYSRFVQAWIKEPHPFELHSIEVNNSVYPFAKVCDPRTKILINGFDEGGLFVDIFPIDKVKLGFDYKVRKKITRGLFVLQYYIRNAYMRNTVSRSLGLSILFAALRPVFIQKLFSKIINMVAKMNNSSNYDYSYELVAGIRCKAPMPYSVYEIIEDRKFENRTYMSVVDYDTYLKATYGNYMELPPENQRVNLHQYTAFRR